AERAGDINRRRCREIFEQRFTAGRMAREYLRVYERLIGTAQRFDGGEPGVIGDASQARLVEIRG
ncbi:MAG TPA: hypothetical protein VFX02_10885, partial [Gammaproteobacteria bacterium]|nr:hypothetical protein [Gammaproteobacteria bacterium]